MARNGKVIVAMSGGVDSSVAACLLTQQGYECVGVFMRVGVQVEDPNEDCPIGETTKTRRLKHGCCSATDAIDARAVAGRLGIPFYALNFEKDFHAIIENFVDEYARGRTPNPCVMCNIHLKFGKLLRYAEMMDAEFVATGHYARIFREAADAGAPPLSEAGGGGRNRTVRLARARNRAKDQSYVLFGIRREDLPRCLFPLGEHTDKAEVRRIAADLGLRVHDKPDSQEICFVPDNDYKQLVHQRRPETLRSGFIRDADGRELGTHDGVASYTIGQRRGLGLALGEPVYVTRLDVLNNTVTVGPKEDLLSTGLIADEVNWLSDPPTGVVAADIKIRHMHTPAAGSIRVLPDGAVEATFDEPQPAVTPGQAAVFYDSEIVLGGGWIREAMPISD